MFARLLVALSLTVTAGNSRNSSWKEVQMTCRPMRKAWQDQYFSGRWHAQEKRIHSGYLHHIFPHCNKYQIWNLIDEKNNPPKPLHNSGCSKPVSGCCDWLFSARNAILFASQCKYRDLVTNQKTRQVFSRSRCEGSNFKKRKRFGRIPKTAQIHYSLLVGVLYKVISGSQPQAVDWYGM